MTRTMAMDLLMAGTAASIPSPRSDLDRLEHYPLLMAGSANEVSSDQADRDRLVRYLDVHPDRRGHRLAMTPGDECVGIVRGRGTTEVGRETWVIDPPLDGIGALMPRGTWWILLLSDSAALSGRLHMLRGLPVRIRRSRDLIIDGRVVPDYAIR